MTFPVVGSNIPGSYEISNSLRFNDGDTPYLTRSTGTTNKRTFTVSVWAKRSTTGARQTLWSSDNNTNDTGDGSKGGSGNYISFWNNGEFYFGGFGGSFQVRSDGLQRDIAGWYHIVAQTDTTQATTNDRGKLWINGVQQTNYVSMIGQNIDVKWATNRIGVRSDQANYSDPTFFTAYMDGYLAELHVVDGQALTASDFGEYDEDSGIWKPKQYAGTYGTDGYYLKFNNSGNMGEDSSGNDNTFTPVNLSGTTDVTTDTPTNNFATLNSVERINTTPSEGNCQFNGAAVTYDSMRGTIGMPSGKWYWEVKVIAIGVGGNIGIATNDSALSAGGTMTGVLQQYSGFKSINSWSNNGSYGGFTTGDIIGVALDMDAGEIEFYKNGTSQGVAYSSLDTTKTFFPFVQGSTSLQYGVNFGNAPFSISSGNSDGNGYGNFEYAPPSGYLALCTQNLATALSPTIDDGSEYFETTTYTGNASTLAITSLNFQPDFLWIKRRSSASTHALFNSNVGRDKSLGSESNDAEFTSPSDKDLISFDSNGFTVAQPNQRNVNGSGQTFVGWSWKANGGTTSSNTDGSITSTVQANTTAGFSIVTYTGTGSDGSVGHGLGVAPKCYMIKARTRPDSWIVGHTALGTSTYPYNLLLNQTSGKEGGSYDDYLTADPTSTVLNLGNAGNVNGSGETYVAYCFADIEGYSKFGSYTGNGSTDGTFVYTGFRPAWVMIKVTDTTEDWWILDTTRDTFNSARRMLYADGTSSELNVSEEIDFLSNGFKLRRSTTGRNGSGNSYIYMAFAENPFVTSGATPVTAR